MEKNFELTEEFKINFLGVKVFRIKATKSFKGISKGDLGGFVEKESNIFGNAWVSGDAEVSGNAMVFGDARVFGNAEVSGNARVFGDARVSGDAEVSGNARVFGDAEVFGDARVFGDAETKSNDDYCCFQNFGSVNRTTTFFKEKNNQIKVSCGCFSGSIKEFEKQVKKTHGDSKNAKEYEAIINVVKIKFGI